MYLTKNELEIMDVLWENERPLSRGELMDLSTDKSWKNSSVHILLNSMLKKGAIKEAGFTRCGKTCGRTYSAALSVEEYYISTLGSTKFHPDPVKFISAAGDYLKPREAELEETLEVLRRAGKN